LLKLEISDSIFRGMGGTILSINLNPPGKHDI
jgi:hypothetical protein